MNLPHHRIDSVLGKLGLRLERAKGSREFLVIDHVEKPSENRWVASPKGLPPTNIRSRERADEVASLLNQRRGAKTKA